MNESDTTGTTVAADHDAAATTAHDRLAALTAIGAQHYQYKRPPALQLQQVLTDTLPPSVPLPSLRQQRQIRHAASARPAADYTESPPESPIVQAKRPPVKSASAGAHRVNAAASRRESSKLNINGQPKRKRTKTGCWTCRRRKIKCDEQYPGCRRCTIARLECEGYAPRYGPITPSSTVASAATSAASSPTASAPPVVANGRSAHEVAQQQPLSPLIEGAVYDAYSHHPHHQEVHQQESPQYRHQERTSRPRHRGRRPSSRENSAEPHYAASSAASSAPSAGSRHHRPRDAVGYGTPFYPPSAATPSSYGGESTDHRRDWHDASSPDSSRESSAIPQDHKNYIEEEQDLVEAQQLTAETRFDLTRSLPASLSQEVVPGAGRGLPALTLPGIDTLSMPPSLTLPSFTFASDDNTVGQSSRYSNYNNTGPLSAPLLGNFQQPFFSATATPTGLAGSRPVSPLLFGNMSGGRSPIPNFSFSSIPGLSNNNGSTGSLGSAFVANPPHRTHSLPVTPGGGPMLTLPSLASLSRLSPIPSIGNDNTPMDFDSLFNFSNAQRKSAADDNTGFSNYFSDQDAMLRMFSSNGGIGHDVSAASSLSQILGQGSISVPMSTATTPGLTASSIISPMNLSTTLAPSPQIPLGLQDLTTANSTQAITASFVPAEMMSIDRSISILNTARPPIKRSRMSAPNSPASDPSTTALNRMKVDSNPVPQVVSFAPQPAIDPLLAASCSAELQRRKSGKLSKRGKSPYVPTLEELDLGPPLIHRGAQKDWSILAEMQEKLNKMENARHVELLQHYFISTCPLFTNVDHPHNPFRTFVAEHVTESMPMLYAVLAIAAINQAPLSVEARAESLLYFESSVDYHVRALEQQDDVGLFTLLCLSLYYAFDAGTQQSQHFSQRAHGIINDRLDGLEATSMNANPDFKFLVRLHVWYEVIANLARRPGELREMPAGKYDLAALLHVIEQWDAAEEQSAGLSSVREHYVGLGLQGVPTFFISLLNEVTVIKEEQHQLQLEIADSCISGRSTKSRKQIELMHARKIRDLESKLQFARPGRLCVPSVVANESQLHRAVSVRFFDLFRLAASIHLLTELQGMASNDAAIQLRITEMVNLLSNIEQNSSYNISGAWAFFIAGAAAVSHAERSVLHRRLDSTWHAPCGNVWTLRSILEECWERNEEALESGESLHSWKEVALSRGWTLLLM